MSHDLSQLITYLQEHGQNITAPRRAVFTALQNSDPLTMAELEKRCPGVDRSSVYRTVMLFERLGVVQRLSIGWKYKLELSDIFQGHHHHLTCQACGKHIEITEDVSLEAQLQALAAAHDFTLKSHQLELFGLCSDCSPRA
ncbi:MAG: Fur family transcriptional regulator [Candidatus Saccharibacteria bacterium]|nr:Fur family transcriptional regulator [Candidatus Saccharibacteria bacterium]